MKKIFFNISLFILAIGAFTSCDDNLDQLPFDSFATDNAFNTAQDFENGIRGVYLQFLQGAYFGSSDGGSVISFADVASDNTTLSQFGRGTKSAIHTWRYSAGSGNMGGLYNNAYFVIYSANQVLYYAQSFEGDNKENIVAEAKAIRAIAHFELVKTFGPIPTQSGDANSALGIAYVTEADANITPPRETVGAVYEKIATDLAEAAADINADNGNGRLNKDAVNIILSRVYLYMGQWQNAINAANAVSTPVAPRNKIVDVWQDTDKSGVVFYIPNDDNSVGVTWSQGGTNNIIPEYVASYELTNTYAADDIRKEAYIISATASGNPVNAIRKFLGKNGGADGKVDIKVYRAAEAKLNIAEAQYNLGNESAARTALDAVRTKRYTSPPSGETGTALRDAIRLERRLEFAFEYQRFFDMKRWGLSITRDGSGDLADGSGVPSEVQNLPAGSFKFQLPIDQSILDRNPNTVQNPGY